MAEEKPTNIWRSVSASWDGEQGFEVVNRHDAKMLMGKARDGRLGIGPMEALLAGLAGCTMYDILEILHKKRQMPTDFKVVVRGNQKVDGYPMPFVEFRVEYLLWGDNLKEKDVEQAVRLSEEKYCSVGQTLIKAGPIQSTYRILKPGESVE